jgi:hypothetical protein
MFMLDLFSWWYGSGWTGILRATRRRFIGVSQAFSIRALLHTLFAPWKRIITSPGASISDRFRAIGDNLISRLVGFSARLFVLLAAMLTFIGLGAMGVLELIVWPLLPLLAVGLIVKGLL